MKSQLLSIGKKELIRMTKISGIWVVEILSMGDDNLNVCKESKRADSKIQERRF